MTKRTGSEQVWRRHDSNVRTTWDLIYNQAPLTAQQLLLLTVTAARVGTAHNCVHLRLRTLRPWYLQGTRRREAATDHRSLYLCMIFEANRFEGSLCSWPLTFNVSLRFFETLRPQRSYAFPSHSVQASSVWRFICSNKSWCLTYSCRKPVRTITRIIATSNNIAAKIKWRK